MSFHQNNIYNVFWQNGSLKGVLKQRCPLIGGVVKDREHCTTTNTTTTLHTWHISMTAVSCCPSSSAACRPWSSCWAFVTETTCGGIEELSFLNPIPILRHNNAIMSAAPVFYLRRLQQALYGIHVRYVTDSMSQFSDYAAVANDTISVQSMMQISVLHNPVWCAVTRVPMTLFNPFFWTTGIIVLQQLQQNISQVAH